MQASEPMVRMFSFTENDNKEDLAHSQVLPRSVRPVDLSLYQG